MNLNTIVAQCFDDSREWFPDKEFDVPFQTLCMLGESGEFANLVKKVERGTHTYTDVKEQLKEELTDTFIYMCVLANILGMNMEEEYIAKRSANAKRFGSDSGASASRGRPLIRRGGEPEAI